MRLTKKKKKNNFKISTQLHIKNSWIKNNFFFKLFKNINKWNDTIFFTSFYISRLFLVIVFSIIHTNSYFQSDIVQAVLQIFSQLPHFDSHIFTH